MVREYTNKLHELIEDGTLSAQSVVDELLCYLSESDVQEFCEEGFAGEIREYFEGLN